MYKKINISAILIFINEQALSTFNVSFPEKSPDLFEGFNINDYIIDMIFDYDIIILICISGYFF